jgi:hypothetical protein
VAILKDECGNNNDISWDLVLHYVISEVARRDPACTIAISRSSNDNGKQVQAMACDLRKSVPLHSAWKEIAAATSDPEEIESILEGKYFESLDAILELADLQKTSQFMETLINGDNFCFPLMAENALVPCPKQVGQIAEAQFQKQLKDFLLFAGDNFQAANQAMLDHIISIRIQKWQLEDRLLKDVGHTALSGRSSSLH